MAIDTGISWTDSTFNPWIGCTKVSAGCKNCYAETLDIRRFSKTSSGGTKESPVSHWGKGAPRHRTKTWGDPVKWDREAGMTGVRKKVFCASLADWLDDEVPIDWLADLLRVIACTPHLDWLLLTKRPENWEPRLRKAAVYLQSVQTGHLNDPAWLLIDRWLPWNGLNRYGPPMNIWVGTSVENQEMADKRIPDLIEIPARIHFLSCEPILGPLDLDYWLLDSITPQFQWVICGGESGAGCRDMKRVWAESLQSQCQMAGVSFWMKQLGGHPDPFHNLEDMPDSLRVRQHPKP